MHDARPHDRAGELAALAIDLLQSLVVDGMFQRIPDIRISEGGIETGMEREEGNPEGRQRLDPDIRGRMQVVDKVGGKVQRQMDVSALQQGLLGVRIVYEAENDGID